MSHIYVVYVVVPVPVPHRDIIGVFMTLSLSLNIKNRAQRDRDIIEKNAFVPLFVPHRDRDILSTLSLSFSFEGQGHYR